MILLSGGGGGVPCIGGTPPTTVSRGHARDTRGHRDTQDCTERLQDVSGQRYDHLEQPGGTYHLADGTELSMATWTPAEIDAQTAAVATLRRDEGLPFRVIADRLGLPTATVHRRWEAVATLDDRPEAENAIRLRHELTHEARTWLARLEAAYLAGRDPDAGPLADTLTVAQAWPLVLKGLEFLARLNGANAPFRVAVGQDGRGRMDEGMRAALEAEARRTEDRDADEVERVLAAEPGVGAPAGVRG